MRSRPVALATALAFGLCLVGLMGPLRAVELKPTEPGTEPPARILPPEPPPPDNPLVRAVRTLEVGRPVRCKNLVVFPLFQRRVTDRRDYLTLDEALSRGELVIKEMEGGTVSKVVFRNTSDRYVFILAHEVLIGGKQNRMLREDLLLRPHSGEVVAEVYCVERGRWHNSEERFSRSQHLAERELRQQAAAGARQEVVWEEVDRFARRAGVSSPTADLGAMQAHEKVSAKTAEYERVIIPALPREAVGLVAVRGSVILGADIFANEALFRKLRRKILRSYALSYPPQPRALRPVSRRQVEEFLRRACRAHYSEREAPDVGRRARIRGAGLVGTGFSFRGSLLHAVLFPRPEPVPRPEPRPLMPRRPDLFEQ